MIQQGHAGRSGELSDFQRATAGHAFRRLYLDQDSTRRFLVADETGLGKTHVARDVIARTIDHLQHVDHVERIDVIYVCSNADIAAQNIRKLKVTGAEGTSFATRLSLLITRPELLKPASVGRGKPVTFVAFTPGTSFQFGWQMGRKEERAVLCVLLSDHLGLSGARETAAQRIFQGGVSSRKRFVDWDIAIARQQHFEPGIRRAFLDEFDQSRDRASLISLIDEVAGRRYLTESQHASARRVVGELRRMLARAAVHALEPDLVILDEFQRFKDLLDVRTGGEAAELADDFFRHDDARVLLLSATPYKPFTYAEEAAMGADHYTDFLKTLEFLTDSEELVESVRADFDQLRQAALAGESTAAVRDSVRSKLRGWISRTERPTGSGPITIDSSTGPGSVQSEDFTGYLTLRRVADKVRAPLTVEYWKSAPYFLNFLRGYRVGEKVREAMRDPDNREQLVPLFQGAQRIAKSDVEQFQAIDWANARMRALSAETLQQGLWRLLWMPPSLPYHSHGGPYESVDTTAITKQLIFSSWVAAPTAIASLLSYEVQRRIFQGPRPANLTRLDYRMTEGRPASMSTLALFWPQPELASHTDPLIAARIQQEPLSVDQLLGWARGRVESLVGNDGSATSTASAAWYWFAPVLAERGGELATALLRQGSHRLAEAMTGPDSDTGQVVVPGGLVAHVEHMLSALGNETPASERPADLRETCALLGLGAPGNIAWRALSRLSHPDDGVTDLGRWRAAAILASGLRSLFARPEAMMLLDSEYAGLGSTRDDDGAYWRRVARYCIDGGLQAVLDEYIHHLAGESGVDTSTDDGLISLALRARRAPALRESVYRATDIDNFDAPGIAFRSRYALRYGNTRYTENEARLPEVRAAFNSPFWPFVLATTSIGQEGIDFHWWCHSIVHWNLPGNPVDFEQREGRVNRYKGHAIRKNVAMAHRSAALAQGVTDPWTAVFEAAASEDRQGLGDLMPFWMYPGDASLVRRIMGIPLSRDEEQWKRLQESLALYRLVFGQPRQEDMLAALQRRGIAGSDEQVAEMRIDLRPPPQEET